ncbi:DUF2808 domain-containing protein [Synechococcus sp. PCC 6312]|uniref:DUF2808 domain-containing protein n=1 Tax=Synechococcus sp. (strain ATCC 27167 / PCC 6312) TaxID=195253 RepID=UPI00029F2DE9|nr:DUF2808 domain-containing protein [Synechococcus sp. PCC 6312]AFY61774.1 Protein of unknown function (DUF2808) [Synechococcus sp. PCC 6312]
MPTSRILNPFKNLAWILQRLTLIGVGGGLSFMGLGATPEFAQAQSTPRSNPQFQAELPPVSQFADGTVFFNQIPQFLGAKTYDPITFTFRPKYYFTLAVPATSLVPLSRVQLKQISGNSTIEFLSGLNQAVVTGNPKIPITITQMANNPPRTNEFLLEPPIQPGQNVTLILTAVRNPTVPGVYLFGVTVYPLGEKVIGNMTGTARLQFRNPGLLF